MKQIKEKDQIVFCDKAIDEISKLELRMPRNIKEGSLEAKDWYRKRDKLCEKILNDNGLSFNPDFIFIVKEKGALKEIYLSKGKCKLCVSMTIKKEKQTINIT